MTSLLNDIEDQPVFCVTSDIDWASPFCTNDLVELLASFNITPTLFATHDCPVIRKFGEAHPAAIGLHPNFRHGSTHGVDLMSVLDHLFNLYPSATCFRSHAFYDSSDILLEMVKRGITYDSNLCLYLQPDMVPLRLGIPGLTRIPVFWEDDCHWMHTGGDWDFQKYASAFLSPGLKVINVHPFMIAANLPNELSYLQARQHVTTLSENSVANIRHDGPGARTFLIDILEFIRAHDLRVYTLDELYHLLPVGPIPGHD